ncbi:MAG: shikimate kinase [Flavobacteriaceae bacterium]|nr:shikimate kinase [Flavobacteriaceae bacterium]
MKVFLLGYMASGKSTIGSVLAKKMNYKFIDLDAFIETQEHLSIEQIFKEKGEIYFRKKESEYLQLILHKRDDFIIALGGGTPCYGGSMELLKQRNDTTTIYLRASISTIVDRLKHEKSKRPLVAHLDTDEALTEFVGKHLFERSYFYNQAEVVMPIDEKDMDEIIDDIAKKLI